MEQVARRELAGHGDPGLGEWVEWTGYAVHIRRRLSEREQEPIGPAVDIRGTPEARKRVQALPPRVRRLIPPDVLAAELGR